MQLPVDVKALLDEVTDISSARDRALAVSVYVDDTAPADLIAHVRNVFASPSSRVRMTVTYIGDSFAPHPTDDIAVIVAGSSRVVGACAAAIRAVGVPVMVATTAADEVMRFAALSGDPIPEDDVVSAREGGGGTEGGFDDEAAPALDERMGRWIVSVCREKRLAFAIAFPFMRRPLAKEVVQLTALENAGVGLVPLIPGADLPIMTLNQAKMVLQIAAAYGQEMDKNRLKELAMVLVGAYVSRGVVRRLVAAVPLLGFLIKAGVAYGTTAAGEDATGVANVMERAAAAGAKLAAAAQEKAADLAPRLSAAVSE